MIHEFAAFKGWYWEIAVPGESHPVERIKEFTLDDPGLGWTLKLNTVGSIHPNGKGNHIYKGSIDNRSVADAVMSCIISNAHCVF